MLVLEALWGSTILRTLAAVFLGFAALWGYGAYKEHQGEQVVVAKVKAKTDKDTRQANQARAQAGGSTGSTDPYSRDR